MKDESFPKDRRASDCVAIATRRWPAAAWPPSLLSASISERGEPFGAGGDRRSDDMPLHFSNWSWTQTESTVYINLPLRGAAAGKVDIVSTEQYLKVKRQTQLFKHKLNSSNIQAVSSL